MRRDRIARDGKWVYCPHMPNDTIDYHLPDSPPAEIEIIPPHVEPEPEPTPAAPAPPVKPKAARLLSLDALRGITILAMLLVNNAALDVNTPTQLLHAPFGAALRAADFVFPWFLFCVGVAIPFAMASAKRKGVPAWRTDVKILTRAASLVLLGLLIESSIQHRPVFSLGVLQTIGLAYLIAALVYELPLSRRLLIAGLALAGYWAALKFIPFPGAAGPISETNNLVYYLNRTVFNGAGLWGITSVIPTSALVLLGTAVGDVLQAERLKAWAKLLILIGIGGALGAGGVYWSYTLLMSKALWTPPYILFMAGTGTLALAALYVLVDLTRWSWWVYPLLVFGSNAILAYVMPILVKLWVLQSWRLPVGDGSTLPLDQWMLHRLIVGHGPIPGGWIYTIGYIVIWWAVLAVFYQKKIFLRV